MNRRAFDYGLIRLTTPTTAEEWIWRAKLWAGRGRLRSHPLIGGNPVLVLVPQTDMAWLLEGRYHAVCLCVGLRKPNDQEVLKRAV